VTATEQSLYLTVRELAQLLRVKERRIYALARTGGLPCRRATGRLLFPRAEIEVWLRRREPQHPAPLPTAAPTLPWVLAGSHDPLLEWALRDSRSGIASFFDGSLDGLDRLRRGEAVAAGMHLAEERGREWNTAHVAAALPGLPVVLLEWAWRERGLIVAAGNPLDMRGLADLAGRRLVPRQPEAGSQLLLEALLADAGVPLAAVVPTEFLARSETDAALAVLDGKADAAFGLAGLARQLRLGFVPLLRERYDLVVDRRAYFEPPFQRFLAFCRSPALAAKAEDLGGYDLSGLFAVRYNAI
jgi:excisionase family DNA binding protein